MKQHCPLLLCRSGHPYPLGSTPTTIGDTAGVNFALAARHASRVTLCLYDADGVETRIDVQHRSDDIWHIFVAGIKAGQRYGWRVDGPVEAGNCYNPQKLLLDPYAREVSHLPQYRTADELAYYHHSDPRDNGSIAPKTIVTAPGGYDWEGDIPPRTPWRDTIIYELHVKGFSQCNPAIPADKRGTFAGLAHEASISHLKNLGITAVELMPVSQHLDETHLQRRGMSNYWGYNVYAHNIPDRRYGSADDLRDMVKTLHRAGIEVILDVVYNHTAEEDGGGPMLCQRGIDNRLYYWQNAHGDYINNTGCGNTINAAEPHVLRWILDSLRYWVETFHIDGFRYDLGSILGRTPAFSSAAPFFAAIRQDPVLSCCKHIAEPWDTGSDGYNLGGFPQGFAEWNGRYRDDMRGFWLWENGWLGALAQRLSGSDDIYRHDWRGVYSSINFNTSHDGFTLRDLTSYSYKHNEANGEDNRDGDNHNYSWNHGIEGESADPAINLARYHSQKALLACLFIAGGIPMLRAGDELGHSQHGNNNSYCQDNKTTWLDWEKPAPLVPYIRALTALRRELAQTGVYDDWWQHDNARWYTADGQPMRDGDWHNEAAKALVLALHDTCLVLINANRSPQTYRLPEGSWQPLLADDGYTQENDRATLAHKGITILRKNNAKTQPAT